MQCRPSSAIRSWAAVLPLLAMVLMWPASSDAALLGHWQLDEGLAGRAVVDATANSLHGRPVGIDAADVKTQGVPGPIGQAARLSGGVSVELDQHAAALGGLTDFTLSMWIQYDGGPSRILFSFSDGTLNHRIQVEVHNSMLCFGRQNGGPWQMSTTAPLVWEKDTWYHVVFVNHHETGKSILRSNDVVWKTDANTLSPSDLDAQVRRVGIGALNGQYPFAGCVDDVRLYDSALPPSEQLALYEAVRGTPDDPQWIAAKMEIVEKQRRLEMARQARELFYAEEAPGLGQGELQQKADWLFQAEGDDLLTRAGKELTWTREMIHRLRRRVDAPDLTEGRAALTRLEERALAAPETLGLSETIGRYFDARSVKRSVMLKSPEIDFSEIICVDAPYTQRSPDTHGTFDQTEWVHESRFRSEMCASHGAKLLVLEDFADGLSPRRLAPTDELGRQAAMLSFDLSFDGERALFCMKPEDDKAYHLYETAIDGQGLRQVTSGGYSDIDPVYLPGSRYLFLSTRADVYAQCGMWARSYILTRCEPDGTGIHILSPGTEPEFSPSLLADGLILATRWEYVDKAPQRIQSLWTMRPDGGGIRTYWGNQSVYPDHLGEARQIPGTTKVIFTGFGHHDVWVGCIGVLDTNEGLNFPKGVWKVTQEMPWPEVGDGPVPTPGLTEQYHTSGNYAAYKTPYPLSEELFLVSARTGATGVQSMRSAHDPTIGQFKLYLMDIYGNRELLYEGDNNILYAQPVRPRPMPMSLPDLADMPGPESASPTIRPGVFFSHDIFDRAPPEIREHGRYLRVVESMPKNYSVGIVHSGGKPFGADGPDAAWGIWGRDFLQGKTPTPATDISWGDSSVVQGPVTSLTGPLGVKQVHGTVPIREDGSVSFEAPPARMLYFQVLDEYYRAVHTMRSWVSARPGEVRGCTGCHESHSATPTVQPAIATRAPDTIQPPPWGVHSLSFVKDVQPVFDRACADCHQGDGEAVEKLDLTLRRDEVVGEARWGGIFPEPYLTLTLGQDHYGFNGWPNVSAARNYIGSPTTGILNYDTLPPLTYLSPNSPLIAEAMDKERCGKNLSPEDLRMLIAWVDLWGMYRSDEEIRAMEDPPAAWFPLWTSPPRTKTAPYVRTEYAQDEYLHPDDRVSQAGF